MATRLLKKMKNVTVDLGRVPLQHAVLVVKRMVETLDVCLPLPACAGNNHHLPNFNKLFTTGMQKSKTNNPTPLESNQPNKKSLKNKQQQQPMPTI